MSNTPLRIFGLVVAVVAVVALAAFLSRGSEDAATVPVQQPDREEARLFSINCGTCHTLAAAGADGVVGPNLDQILPTSVVPPAGSATDVAKAQFDNWNAIYGRVLNAVTCGLNGRMPKGILEGEQAQEIAGFVAAYAGQLSPDAGPVVPAGDRKLTPAQPCAGESGTGTTPGPAAGGGGSSGSSSG